jgi:hypothetical protein
MRTTFTLDPDVAAEVERVRRSEGIGISEAVNRLLRSAMVAPEPRARYKHKATDLGLKVDVSDIGAVLDLLDDE